MACLLNDSDDNSGTDDSSISDLDDNDFSLSTSNTSLASSLNSSPTSFSQKLHSWMNETESDKLPNLKSFDFSITSGEESSDDDQRFGVTNKDGSLPRFHIVDEFNHKSESNDFQGGNREG